MALLDEGETDWKLLVIANDDPMASKVNDVEDIEKYFPGLLRATNEWFRIYKIPDGKPENQFAFSGECKNKKYAEEVVRECNESWEKLLNGKIDVNGCCLDNTTHDGHASVKAAESLNLADHEDLLPAEIDSSIDKWFFISGATA